MQRIDILTGIKRVEQRRRFKNMGRPNLIGKFPRSKTKENQE